MKLKQTRGIVPCSRYISNCHLCVEEHRCDIGSITKPGNFPDTAKHREDSSVQKFEMHPSGTFLVGMTKKFDIFALMDEGIHSAN